MSILRLFLLIFLFHTCSSQNDFALILNNIINASNINFPLNLNLQQTNEYMQVMDFWLKLQKSITWLQEHASDNLCYQQLNMFFSNDSADVSWKINMLDATAKPQSGILFGNTMHMGNYDQCLKISSNNVHGKYCTTLFSTNKEDLDEININNSRFVYGICIPASCNSSVLQPFIEVVETNLESPANFKIMDEYCSANNEVKPLTAGNIFGISIFGIFGILLLVSTLYDIIIRTKGNNMGLKLLLAFSVYSNGKKLFNTKSSEGSLNCLNGLRVISMAWIVLGHAYMFSGFLPASNIGQMPEVAEYWFSYVLMSTSMAVDTFFAVSGLLVVYIYLKNREKTGSSSLGLFYIHRILRLTPALIMVIILSANVYSLLGSGPLWFVTRINFEENCKNYWWTTLFYIQNYVHIDHMCVPQSWYLAVDTQMYFLSPILFYFLIRWPKSAMFGTALLGIASCIYAAIITWENKYVTQFFDETSKQFDRVYVPTHVRGSCWIVGAIFGYIFFTIRNRKIKIPQILAIFLWVLSLTIMLGIIYFHKVLSESVLYETSDTLEQRMYSTFYNGFVRPIWSIALCTIIFLCIHGYGGIINQFLSASIFTVLIRVNYSMYLLHMLVIMYFYAQKRNPEYLAHIYKLQEFWGNFVSTLVVSIVWTLAFESPIVVLEKMLFSKKHIKTGHKAENTNGHVENGISFIEPKNIG